MNTGDERGALLNALVRVVGEANVITDEQGLAPYVTDWRGRYRGRALCVVKPGTTAEVAAVVKACGEAGTTIVPQGGNTGLVGGATPDDSGRQVVVGLARMGCMRAIDLTNNTITVEAGCTLATVQEMAASHDRLFPLSLAAEGTCQIGGNLSSNAGGVHVLRYGNTRELTLGLEVVLADGSVWNGLRGLRKDNTGYDLKHLFIGAEGTLGIITAAVLKLVPRPRDRVVAWLGLNAPRDAIELLSAFRSHFGESLTAFEIVGSSALELVLRHIPGTTNPLSGKWPWMLLVELAGSTSASGLAGKVADMLGGELERGRIGDATIAQDIRQADSLWRLRESVSEAQRIDGLSIKHDVAVPISRIPEFLAEAESRLVRVFGNVRIVAFGHIGDGNLHYNLSRPTGTDGDTFIDATLRVNHVVHDLVAELGGTISAEHGLGQLKRGELRRYKAPIEITMMERVKQALDPKGLLNPGKLL